MPGTFPALLKDFACEVLRDQPENIYEYGARYFAAMEEGQEFIYDQNGEAPEESPA